MRQFAMRVLKLCKRVQADRFEFANQRGIYGVRALSLINQLIRVISLLGLVMVCALSTFGL